MHLYLNLAKPDCCFLLKSLSAFKLSIPNPQSNYILKTLEGGISLIPGFSNKSPLIRLDFAFQSLGILKYIFNASGRAVQVSKWSLDCFNSSSIHKKKKKERERKGKKRAEGQGLKFREASELEKQGKNEAKMTEKDSHEMQTLNLGSPLSKIFKQKYSHNQKILVNLSERNKQWEILWEWTVSCFLKTLTYTILSLIKPSSTCFKREKLVVN